MKLQIIYLIFTFVITAILGKIIIPVLRKFKIGQVERTDGPRTHLKKQGTPTMGGIIMILSIIIPILVLSFFVEDNLRKVILILAITSIGFGLVGFIDDYKKLILKNTDGLSPRLKMLGQLLVAVTFSIVIIRIMDFNPSTYIPFLKITLQLPKWLYIVFIVLVMLSSTNAINLTDGVDGLATMITAIMMAALSIIAYRNLNAGVSIFSAIICGTCLGFYIYNMYKAKVIMGDTGSLFLGGALSCIAIYLNMPIILVILAIIPVLETVSVILQVAFFRMTKRRLFKMAPLHHHLELIGWRETKVVACFSIITIISSIVSVFAV
ncbi:MAG: phospho-N-acetylmuramoyl-pentapeptide-transferase [Candidatus Scatovivens sp.]